MDQPSMTEPAIIVQMDYDLHRVARMKASQAGMGLPEIVRQWMRAWVAGNLPTPPREPRPGRQEVEGDDED